MNFLFRSLFWMDRLRFRWPLGQDLYAFRLI